MPVMVRGLEASDSVDELTELLHEAYRQLGEMGLNYTAVDQDSATTLKRIKRGQCLVAVREGLLVGTVTWYPPGTLGDGSAWYRRPGVAAFGQFAVHPREQGNGFGLALLGEVERLARLSGATELALDTAEPAGHLIEFYSRRGFRHVDTVQWTGKTYRSVIMSKSLG